MKKILKLVAVIFTATFIISLTFTTSKIDKVEAVSLSNYSKPAQTLIQKYKIPLSNSDGYALNEAYLLQNGIVVYGGPSNISGNDYKSGQYRFLGYTVDGIPYANYAFPNDLDTTASVAKNWIKDPWYKAEGMAKGINPPSYLGDPKAMTYVAGQLKTMLDSYDPNNQKFPATGKTWLQSYNQLTGANWTANTLLDYVTINNFSSDFGPGSATMWNLGSTGTWWYQTFVIPPRIIINDGSNPPINFQCTDGCGDTKTSDIVHTDTWNDCTTDSNGNTTCVPRTMNYYENLTSYIDNLSPLEIEAGFGFSFSVETHYQNQYDANAQGPTQVVAYFPNADSFLPTQVNLVPTNPAGSWDNTWTLPKVYVEKYSGNLFYNPNDSNRDVNDTLLDGGNKWYTPFKQKDGSYNVRVEVKDTGTTGLHDCQTGCILVSGSPFNDYFPRLISPSNPFPTGVVGDNWQGKEYILTNLTDWYSQKEDTQSVDRSIDENNWVK